MLQLLQHPAVKHILEGKWNTLGWPLYFLQLLLYCLLVLIPLSILVLLPVTANGMYRLGSRLANNYYIFVDFMKMTTAYILAGIIIIVTLFYVMVFRLPLIKKSCKKSAIFEFFFPLINKLVYYTEVLVFTLAVIFSVLTVVNVTTKCCEQVTWHFGLFAVTFGWSYLIHLCSKLPLVGEQAIVFIHTVWTFLKLSFFALLLVIAATIILTMTFFNPQALVSCSMTCSIHSHVFLIHRIHPYTHFKEGLSRSQQ